ncbi:MAG: hypothetical protein QJR05_12020 [Thermoanaerobacterium sp.]|nr:hypothetical protein [Thermoanaerobacterium sp.]
MKKVLMITPAFPPIGGSHMHRVVNFANSIAKIGIELHVIACEPSPGHPNIDYGSKELVDNRIKVYYVPEGILHRSVYNSMSICKNELKSKKLVLYRLRNKLYELGNKFKKRLLIPDTMIDWYFSVLRYLRENNLIEKIKPEAIISCSMPNTVHIISYRLVKKYNLKLIMDYGDPWVYEKSVKRGKIRFMLEHYIEKKILKKASLVCFATKATRDLYVKEYNLKPEMTTVAMMGFYTEDIDKDKNSIYNYPTSEYLIMIYGGSLNPAHRDPLPFFEALNHLQGFIRNKLRIYLRVDDVSSISRLVKLYNLEDIITVKGYIPFSEYLNEMKNCDVLILFGNNSSMQIPGKLFNYIGTGMRILYIKNMDEHEYDDVEEILRKYGNVTFAQNNVSSVLDAILSLYKEKINGNIKRISVDHILEYSWQNQALIFAKAVLNIINNNK